MTRTIATRRALLKATGASTAVGLLGVTGVGQTRAAAATTSSWTQFRGGPAHSGSTAVTPPDQLETTHWVVGDESRPASFPAVADGTVYVGVGTDLLAFDNAAGKGRWRTDLGAPVVHSPAVDEDQVFVTLEDGSLIALSRTDGSEQWRVGLGGQPSAPTVVDGTVYAGTTNDRIAAFDAGSGNVRWTDERTVSPRSPDEVMTRPTPTYADGTVFVNVNGSDSGLVALDAETGTERWVQWFSDGEDMLVPAVSDGTLALTFGYPDTMVKVLSTSGGIVQWEQTLANIGTRFPAAVDENLLAVAVESRSGETSLLAYDLDTGAQRWSYEDSGRSPGGVTIGSDAVYLTSFTGGSDESLVRGLGRENGFEQLTTAIDFPTRSGFGPVPTDEALVVPDGHRLRAVGGNDSSKTEAPEGTDQQSSSEATEHTAIATPRPEDASSQTTGSGGLFSLEVAGTLATIVAAIGTLLQVLKGN